MHRERGLHLDEPMVTVDGNPISATVLGTALTLFLEEENSIEKEKEYIFISLKLNLQEKQNFIILYLQK